MKKFYFTLTTLLFIAVANSQIVNIPDANFKAKLLLANTSNNIASSEVPNANGFVTAFYKIDTNNDGEIQVSEASLIKWLNISSSSISNLEGILSFTNLIKVKLHNNNLSILNISGLANLKFLDCSANPLGSLNVDSLNNLQELICYGNSLSTLNLSNLNNLQVLNCSTNYLQNIDFSNLINLRTLSCGANLLTNISVSNLTNLTNLSCGANQLASLNVNSLINLTQLTCDDNQLSNLEVGNLINLNQLTCNDNQLSSLNVGSLINLTQLICDENQITTLDVTNSANLTTLYCDYNQLSTLNVSGLDKLQTLGCTNNFLTELNLDGLVKLRYLYCSINQIASLNATNSPLLQVLEGGYNQLVTLFIKNNNEYWQTLDFSNNSNLQYVCTNDDDILLVQNLIVQYGYSATCHLNTYCSFNPGGTFYTIQGNSKFDADGNGCDINDLPIGNLKFNITNSLISGSLISNISGNYFIPVSAGLYYITPQFENPSYFYFTPTTAIVNFPSTPSPAITNFCVEPNGVRYDLEVVAIPLDDARPGFDANYKIKYKNKGNQIENATINFNYNDAILDFVSTTVAPTAQASGTLSWNVGTIAPFQSGEILVTLNVNSPMEIPPVNGNDVLSYTTTASGLNTDETPDDNTFTLNQVVVNSFDPNDKTCLEGTTISPTLIGNYVHYKIRFENTGTFAAENVVVKDIIDISKFEISSLQLIDASHSCITRINGNDKVEFIFENINLPFDHTNNDGYLVFKIRIKPTVLVNSTITNSANIYFDYNFPIVTNTATSTFAILKNDSFEFHDNLAIYPNPVENFLNITTKQATEIYQLTLYTILGQQLHTITNPKNTVDVSSLKTGNYILKVLTNKGISSVKFVKK